MSVWGTVVDEKLLSKDMMVVMVERVGGCFAKFN